MSFKSYVNIFQFDTELPGSGEKIVFKPVTTGQMKKLLLYETSQDPNSIENALDDMISECVVSPEDFDIKKQYLQDRFYLLVDIRKATRGSQYTFQSTCASCSSQSQHNINITTLPVVRLKKTPVVVESKPVVVEPKKPVKKTKMVEVTDEPIKTIEQPKVINYGEWDIVKLNEYVSVRLSIITRDMQVKAFSEYEKAHNNPDEFVSDNMKAIELSTLIQAFSIISIITPDGEETGLPIEDKLFLLNNINQSEIEKISQWYEDNDFGLDFSFTVKCPQCGYTEKKAVPVENFFY